MRRYDPKRLFGAAVADCPEIDADCLVKDVVCLDAEVDCVEAEFDCLEAVPAKKMPQAMETAKQSMARPSAIRMMSIRFMQCDVQKVVPQRYTFLVSLQPNQGT